MKDFLNKFKIPTILGLSIIFAGIAGGVYLVLQNQTFLSQASPDITAQNITITNITENSAVISWQTNSAVSSFVNFGQNSLGEQTALDDRDNTIPKPHLIHYVTLKNLLAKTIYQFKIVSSKISSDVIKFTTIQPLTSQTGFSPIIGSVLDGDSPLDEGIAYLFIDGVQTQSALIKNGGNFLIPLSNIDSLAEGMLAKVIISSSKGEANLLFKLQSNSSPLPPIKLGQSIDLTIQEENPQKYDLNGDGKINSSDYAIILQNFGKKGKDIKGDLNGDGKVDQKDLDLMSKQINQ